MSLATLLTGGSGVNPAFPFEHAASHLQIANAIQLETNTVVTPYWLDPRTPVDGMPASLWQIAHQNAHNEWSALGMTYGGQNMVDANLNQPEPLTWSLFVNLAWHQAALQELGPLVS